MHTKTLALVGALAGGAVAETVVGAVVFSRHGDRSTKHYGAQSLTSLGASQNFQVGSDYRARYLASGSPQRILNMSEFTYVSSQLYASAPNQGILLNTATAFLQGMYPPLSSIRPEIASTTLNNGSASTAPVGGYQYVQLQSEKTNSPDTIWIKGDDFCPTVIAASESFEDSDEFAARVASTRDFYQRFLPVLRGAVYDYTSPDNMSYAKAYDIFDLVNVARIHNATSPARNVSDADLAQLRTLADSAEFGYNFNASQPLRSLHAQTLSAAILAQLNQTVATKGKLKFSLLAGSYDTMLAFFGVTNLTAVSGDFFGLPDYASTLAFELFTPETATAFPANPDAALRVRFLFRNGTAGQLTPFPLFGTGQDSLAWPDFVAAMKARAVTTAKEWCAVCQSKVTFCAAYKDAGSSATGSGSGGDGGSGGGLSNAVAGVIGAMVTLGVVLILGALAFVLLRKRKGAAQPAASTHAAEKTSLNSGSDRAVNV